MPAPIRFPNEFLWGAATSAYQIEGSPLADGAGPSNWHHFSHTPGRIENGDTGDVACDHYRRWREDVAIMRDLGLNAYRFSLAWSRILPEGRGRVNAAGLDFYSRLVDQLLEGGIKPCATLNHWDLPAALDRRGGWLNRDMADWFADYAEVVFQALGDRVAMWMTINEPWVIVDAGFQHGVHAPGHRSSFEAPFAAHHLLLGHGKAVDLYRRSGNRTAPIGLVVNIEPKYSSSASAEDEAATQRADAYMNRQYLDPVFLGKYPDEMRDIYGEAWPDFSAEDFATIGEPTDFLGINYYTRGVMKHDDTDWPVRASKVRQPGHYTETDWEVHPESLTRMLLWIRERYGDRPLYITENGAAYPDPAVASESPLKDPLRVDYYREHLRAAYRAMEQGVDLRGYFAWSLLDNFEWGCGYSKRLGLVHVDYATQKRTMKESGEFYAEVIRTKGEVLGESMPRGMSTPGKL